MSLGSPITLEFAVENGGSKLQPRPACFAVHRIIWVLSLASIAHVADDRHPRNCEGLACSLVQVELVSLVAAEPRNMIALKCPFSLWRT